MGRDMGVMFPESMQTSSRRTPSWSCDSPLNLSVVLDLSVGCLAVRLWSGRVVTCLPWFRFCCLASGLRWCQYSRPGSCDTRAIDVGKVTVAHPWGQCTAKPGGLASGVSAAS
jgi:hypothetical protein